MREEDCELGTWMPLDQRKPAALRGPVGGGGGGFWLLSVWAPLSSAHEPAHRCPFFSPFLSWATWSLLRVNTDILLSGWTLILADMEQVPWCPSWRWRGWERGDSLLVPERGMSSLIVTVLGQHYSFHPFLQPSLSSPFKKQIYPPFSHAKT